MGGKHKVANRTKNNARPSSSGRSASMLNSLPGFSGFSGTKESSGLSLFSFGPTEEFDSSVDESFQLVIKKISKKDSTTKLKGLQEFADLVKNSEPEAVKAVLPLWPRFYSVLVTDPENRVREATHNVQHEIVKKVRREIAPFIKQIMAPWFTSQYDNYPPAATAAVQAFKDTFSEVKFQEAIVYCQSEILHYIYENLSCQIDQNVAENSCHDIEAKYERILISCLQGYSLYLQKVPKETIEESNELNSRIVLNNSFWKLANSKISLIRSAWFQVMSVILQRAPFLLKHKESQVIGATLLYLEDDDPLVAPHIWECVLLATSVIPDWWQYTNIEKKVIPKLLKVLRQAGQGNATIIYPNLLPLLSNMPLMDNERAAQFYDKFFEAIRSGLKLKSANSSKSESSAIAVALMECLKYTIMRNASEFDMCKALIKEQLISVLDWCLTDKAACHKKIFTQTALFVQDLSGNSKATLNEALVVYFFDSVRQMFRELFQSNSEHILLISERQLEFIRSFKQSNLQKQGSCVKFALNDDEKGCNTEKVEKDLNIQNKVYSGLLEKLGINIFQDYVNYINENLSKDLIKNLYLLVIAFNKEIFYNSLLEKMKDDNESAKYMDIYDNLLKKWLLSQKLCCKSVIELIYFLLPFLVDKDKHIVLDDLIELGESNFITWSISTALSHPHVEDKTIRNWLKNDIIGDFFVSIAKKQIRNECSLEERIIFKQALEEHNSEEPVLTRNALKEILAKVTSTLLDNNTTVPTLDSCLRLAVDLCSIIYTSRHMLFHRDTLLLTLFEISCRFEYKKESVLTETLLDVESAWQNALLGLIGYMGEEYCDELVQKLAATIDKQFRLASVAGRDNVEHLGDIIVSCISVFHKRLPYMVPVLNGLIGDKFWRPEFLKVLWLCKAAEYLKGNLLTPYEQINFSQSQISEKDILHYFTWCYFKFYVMCSKLSTDESRLVLNVISKMKERNYLDILFTAQIGESFLTHYSNVKYHSEISYYYLWLKKKSEELLSNLELAERACSGRTVPECDVPSELITMCEDDGDWFWIKLLYNVFLDVSNKQDFLDSYSNFTENIFENKPLFKMHLNHFVSKNSHFATNKIDEEFVKELIEQMENLRKENLSEFLYEDPKNMPWSKSYPLIQVVRKCADVVKNGAWNQRFWDLLVVSMASWMSNCFKARSLLQSLQYQTMLVSVSELYMNTCTRIANFKKEQVNMNYVNEWEDIVLENIHNDLVQIWLFLADELLNQSDGFIKKLPLTQYFGPVTEHIKYDLIFSPNDNLPKWTKFLKKSCSLLTNSQTILQLWGYRMLKTMIPGLIKIDTEAVNTNTPHRKGLIFEQFKEKLNEVENVVNSMLIDFKIGEDTCKVEPSYDSFTYTFAYLLLWDVMLSLFEHAAPELRYQYADWLKNSDILQSFLSNMFKLIPPEMSMHNEEKSKSFVDWFLNSPLDSSCYGKSCDSQTIEQMVCYLYKSSLVQLPALVRQWWTDLEIKASQLVDKITILYVSPYLCTEELNDVIQCQNSFKNMKVRVLPGIREILAVYTIDETQMELTITLPVNYPLGSPTIQCNRQISGANQKQWLLQFKKCVLHQNGRIWDGLSLWNNNLDRKFDGVEECYICYAVLHFGTCQLPRLTCQTCKKKFHSACLYKWFSTSNKSSCPICRNWF